MDVKPNYCSLETVFSENTLYEVPMFQRAYSWKSENVNQFTSDIENLYLNINKGGDNESHFFGGIVCVKQKNKDVLDEKTIYQLVDGQQRLSTTVLLVSRLIVYLKSLKLTDEQSGIRERRIQKYKLSIWNLNQKRMERTFFFLEYLYREEIVNFMNYSLLKAFRSKQH